MGFYSFWILTMACIKFQLSSQIFKSAPFCIHEVLISLDNELQFGGFVLLPNVASSFDFWFLPVTIWKNGRLQGQTCGHLERQRTSGKTDDVGKDRWHFGKTLWQSERRLTAWKDSKPLVSWNAHHQQIRHRNGLEPGVLGCRNLAIPATNFHPVRAWTSLCWEDQA